MPACENQKCLLREAGGKLWELGVFWVSRKDDKIVYHEEWQCFTKGKVEFLWPFGLTMYICIFSSTQ